MKILVSGSTAYDVLLGYDGSFADAIDPATIQNLSVSFLAPHYARHHGGTAPNIAWSIHLLGGDPLVVSTIGNDGGEYETLLRGRGISTEYLERKDDAITATAIIGTDSGQRQVAFFHPGADGIGSFPDLTDRREEFSYAVISPRNPVLMMEAVRWCKKYAVKYLFDPGQLIIGLSSDELLFAIEDSAGVITNEYEWDLLSNKTKLTEESVLTKTTMAIVTRGDAGVTCFTADGADTVGPCKAEKVVNPTGAGDAFRAGFLVGLTNGWNKTDALRLGNSMGSFIVELEGTLPDTLDKEEVIARAEQAYGEKLPELNI